MKNFMIFISITFFSVIVSAGLDFENCNLNDIQILKDHTYKSKHLIIEIQNNFVEYERKFHKQIRQMDLAHDIMDCSYKRLDHITYVCNAHRKDDSVDASTDPILGRRVRLNEKLPHYSSERISAILIHEATHKCGTTDAAYFNPSYPPRNIGIFGWPVIASTYSFWVEYGFCIPGIDCQTP